MVRRWSYLENTSINLASSGIAESSNMHTFKVFKKTTRFKKFSKGITSFVRRKNVRRRVKSSLIFTAIISSYWLKAYLFIKRSTLICQAMYTSQLIATTPSDSFSYNKTSSINFAYNYISVRKKRLPTYFSGCAQLSQVNNTTNNNVNSYYLDNVAYEANSLTKTSSRVPLFMNNFISLNTSHSLRFAKEVRKVIILLTLFRTFK